jgi:cellulose synthase/poly-beta-1,6-N-acetylglucosamine synthase-like glycosyltransferase
MILVDFVFVVSVSVVGWVYAGYPLLLGVLGRVRPRPHRRAPIHPSLSVVVAAYDEEAMIARKVADVRASDYPRERIEIIVASDGSVDRTVAEARAAGAEQVLDLPRMGKMRALVAAVEHAHGDVLVFSDADSRFERGTLGQLVSNFADESVGAVAANEVHVEERDGTLVGRGEGLYWRYENWVRRAEDRVGNVVSAGGRLFAMRRELFRAPNAAHTDDFAISTQVIPLGRRLVFDRDARVLVQLPTQGRAEMRRKVRVMNRGLRAACALFSLRLLRERPAYALQLFSHKILRRFVAYFLLAALVASTCGAAHDPRWWIVLAPQCAFYAAALGGAIGARAGRRPSRVLAVAYYFCLANLAAAIAVASVVVGVRYERWQPELSRALAPNPGPMEAGA